MENNPKNGQWCEKTAALTVAFNPDIELLAKQISSLDAQCKHVIIDNGSETISITNQKKIYVDFSNVTLICLGENKGIAYAQNTGIDYIWSNFPFIENVILLDHDSIPELFLVSKLYNTYLNVIQDNQRIAAIGPKLIESRSNEEFGFC